MPASTVTEVVRRDTPHPFGFIPRIDDTRYGMATGTTISDDTSASTDAAPPRPCLFLCLDADHPTQSGESYDLSEARVVDIGRDDSRRNHLTVDGGRSTLRLDFADARMSRQHARLERVMGQWIFKDQGSRNGSMINGSKREHAPLADGDLIEIGRTFLIYRECTGTAPVTAASVVPGMRTLLPDFAIELERIRKVAASTIEVLIQGEAGTGKELLARQIHAISARPGSFVPVDCGAIPGNLVEGELFGHERGAFVGADADRPGRLRLADHGTLFLDEIADLPLAAQTAFLRALEDHQVMPLGASQPVDTDFRLIAASHLDVRALEEDGEFRADLFSRLAGYTITLPPLRRRKEDLGLIIADILTKLEDGRSEPIRFSTQTARTLIGHSWKHNIRELEKCLAVAMVLSDDGEIKPECLPAHVQEHTGEDLAPPVTRLSGKELSRREQIVTLLAEHDGNVSAVARDLGKGRTQIRRWILRYEIDPSEFR